MDKKYYIDKRTDFFRKLPDNSVAIICSGMPKLFSEDSDYPFEVERNFYYFTGVSFKGMKLVMAKLEGMTKSVLIIPKPDHDKEKWTGRYPTKEECEEKSGIKEIVYTEDENDYLHSLLGTDKFERLYLFKDNIKKGEPQSRRNAMIADYAKRYPCLRIVDLSLLTMPMRAVKSHEEVECIKKSAALTKIAVEQVMETLRPGIKEYQAQAVFEYVVKRNGGKIAFNTIAASGENATTLHYVRNDSMIREGDLLLLDCGASLDWYNADVTRTIPASGKFTNLQRKIYDVVLEANKYIISSVKPGLSCNELNALLKEFYASELLRLGLINEESEVSKYYYHGVSHSLGLDVHDVFDKDMTLEPGMVITVEPGLYFAEYGIGIRIEDDVLVTERGCAVLTNVPKEADEIEKIMSR